MTKCILITEQQMSRMELLCCLNSRTLHFSGLTSHRIHLPVSCQFRLEGVKEGREMEQGGRLTPVRPSPPSACLAESLPSRSVFPRWPVQLVICITTHTSTHSHCRGRCVCVWRGGGGGGGGYCLCLLAAAQSVALDMAGSQRLWHKTACS